MEPLIVTGGSKVRVLRNFEKKYFLFIDECFTLVFSGAFVKFQSFLNRDVYTEAWTSINGLYTENLPLSQRTPTPLKINPDVHCIVFFGIQNL